MPGDPAVFAEGPGYRLRSLTLRDVVALAAFSEDELYWRYLSHGPRTESQVQRFVERAISVSEKEGAGERWWAVVDPDTDTVIGTANMRQLGADDAPFGSVGCSLAPGAQGNRLGMTLGWAMIAMAFERFDWSAVECTCAEANERSFHIMRNRFHMRYDGLREDSVEGRKDLWPVHVFSFTRDEYDKQSLAQPL